MIAATVNAGAPHFDCLAKYAAASFKKSRSFFTWASSRFSADNSSPRGRPLPGNASCPSIVIPSIGLDVDAEDICGVFAQNNKRLFGSEPERGDVVVFRHPVSGRDFIKRLVGLPGDRIQVTDSVLSINGEPVKLQEDGVFVETYEPQGPQGTRPRCSNGPVGQGAACEKNRFIETFPDGNSHFILEIGNQSMDNTGVYLVPEGHYFFMGDNRDNSSDSRLPQSAGGVGFVPFENLIGRADRVMFSSAGRSMLFFWTWRGDRFFKAIQ